MQIGIYGPQNACVFHMRKQEVATQLYICLNRSLHELDIVEAVSFCHQEDGSNLLTIEAISNFADLGDAHCLQTRGNALFGTNKLICPGNT